MNVITARQLSDTLDSKPLGKFGCKSISKPVSEGIGMANQGDSGRVPSEPGAIACGDGAQEVSAHSGDAPSRDFVNDFFRAHYPPDWDTAWEMGQCAGSYGRRYMGAYKDTHDTVFPRMVCADGLKLSVQGHFGAYSYPRGDFENEYRQVEIMGPPDIPEFAGLPIDGPFDDEVIYPYVPVALVNKLIADRGGLASDSDRSGEAMETAKTGSTEGESAVAKPIAQSPPVIGEDQYQGEEDMKR